MIAQHDGDVTTNVACVEKAGTLEMLESKLLNGLIWRQGRDGINSKLVNNPKIAYQKTFSRP